MCWNRNVSIVAAVWGWVACALLAYEQSPSFRPRWKYFDWRLSALGACLCARR